MKVLNSAQFIVLEINIDIIINEVQNISMLSVFLNVHMSVCVWGCVCGMSHQGLVTLTPVYPCCLERKTKPK